MKQVDVMCIIDDDEIYQFTARKSIEALGTTKKVLVFSDGEEGIEYLKAHGKEHNTLPDMIFLDLNMPYLDGWGFLDEFAKIKPSLHKDIDIYVVSSSVLDEDRDRATKISEVSGYIIKPITVDKFRQIIEGKFNK